MSANMSLGVKLAQQLKMTPQLQQSIKILTLSVTELEQEIRAEMLQNPVIEEVQHTAQDQTPEELSNKEEEVNQPTWVDYSDYTAIKTRGGVLQKTSSVVVRMDAVVKAEQSLSQHLLWQVQMSGFSNQMKAYLAVLVDYLNEDGYLKVSLEEIVKDQSLDLKTLKESLKQLHTLDPTGVGARNLKECLLIQAKHNQEDTHDLVELIENHLPDLEKKDFSNIALRMKLEEEEVLDLYKIVSAMEPKPGRRFSTQPIQYITPDVYVVKDGRDYRVLLNEEGIPHLKVADFYQDMLKNWNNPENKKKMIDNKTHKYLRHKMNSALWLIKSLNQRQKTIYSTTKALVKHQREFFDKGRAGLKPLVLQTIADEIGVHVSTVSRTTTNKYVHTPHGIFELKYFFHSGFKDKEGGMVSVEKIKWIIKSYIEKEDAKKPLSDQDIVNKLEAEQNLVLNRRVVTKYRERMNILSYQKRKRGGL